MSYFDDNEDFLVNRKSHGKVNNTKQSPFSRGYSEPRQRMRKSCGYTMSCFNCKYYYQSVGDKEETCQNNSVLEYDMIVDGHRVYCTHWEMCDKNDDSLFKKSGRSRLD